ncbi:hypothetical protein [Metabacillus sediminilitoris]|nr:hypothetical protein [Metabacillus sediminilitoris]
MDENAVRKLVDELQLRKINASICKRPKIKNKYKYVPLGIKGIFR